jgi:methyl-accepting chemotaxis protein
MNIRLKITLIFLILTIPSFFIGYLAVSQLNEVAKPINKEIPQYTQKVVEAAKRETLSRGIRYYDEVLTQAARNYAFTKNVKWEEIYIQSAPILDETIKEAIALSDGEDIKIFQEIDSANLALVKMEENSMELVDNNKQQEAINILESEDYWTQKEIYEAGLAKFIKRKGLQYNEALITSTEQLEIVSKNTREIIDNSSKMVAGVVVVLIIIIVLLGILIPYMLTKRIILLKEISMEIAKGNLGKRAETGSNDEIGQLAIAFNEMTDKLQQSLSGIEKKVEERTAELEKTNKFMVDRELKMVELKKRITELEAKS